MSDWAKAGARGQEGDGLEEFLDVLVLGGEDELDDGHEEGGLRASNTSSALAAPSNGALPPALSVGVREGFHSEC